jgi:hypothetical protein
MFVPSSLKLFSLVQMLKRLTCWPHVPTFFIKEENWLKVIMNFDCSVIIWDMWNTSYVMLCYVMLCYVMLCYVIRLLLMPCLPNYDTPFQYSVFRKVPMQSLYNFVHHIMTQILKMMNYERLLSYIWVNIIFSTFSLLQYGFTRDILY